MPGFLAFLNPEPRPTRSRSPELRMSISHPRQHWLSNVRGDLLAGLVVALALIPEAIAFSIFAGVDPRVGLYASFSMAVIIAFSGGRNKEALAEIGHLDWSERITPARSRIS